MLKIIACLTMLIDHMGYVLFPGQFWMRIVGRIAFPLFAWYVARGFDRTRRRGRYLLRLRGWGLISQLPFVMLFYGGTGHLPQACLRAPMCCSPLRWRCWRCGCSKWRNREARP
jgi:hypothetical protein